MSEANWALALGAGGLIAAVAGALGAWAASRWGPRQGVTARSSHVRPTPVGGGIGLPIGVAIGLCTLVAVAPDGELARRAAELSPLVALAGAAALVGVLDDLLDLGARLKIGLLGVLAGAIALGAGAPTAFPLLGDVAIPLPFAIGALGAALWAFTAINTVNFMDGANGLIGGAMAIAHLGLGVVAVLLGAPAIGAVALFVACACAGFLPWNARARAEVFLGDTGALFLGAMFAGLSLALVAAAPAGAIYLAPVLLAPILVDSLGTLWVRARRWASILEAHREHAYQQRILAGMPHLKSSAIVWRQSALCAKAAAIAAAIGHHGIGGALAPATLAALLITAGGLAISWARARSRAVPGARRVRPEPSGASLK